MSREEFEEKKKRLEAGGFKVITRYRKGLKSIRLAPIVLGYDKN